MGEYAGGLSGLNFNWRNGFLRGYPIALRRRTGFVMVVENAIYRSNCFREFMLSMHASKVVNPPRMLPNSTS